MNNFKHLLLAAALGVASLGASAAPLSALYYSQEAGWLDPQADADAATFFQNGGGLVYNGVANLVGGGAPANTYHDMQWYGTGGPPPGAPQSSINVQGHTTNSVDSGKNDAWYDNNVNGVWNQGEWFKITTVTQNNGVLGASGQTPNPLWKADILANFRIFADAGLTTLMHADINSATRLQFNETNNNSGCPQPEGNPIGSTCDDVYTLLAAELDPLVFFFAGFNYMINFTLEPANALTVFCTQSSDPGCAGTPDDGFLRVYTGEGQNSGVNVLASWSVIPEPGSLALAGLGLVGLALARRRKTAA